MWFRNILTDKPNARKGSARESESGFNGLSAASLRSLNHLALNTGTLLQGMPSGNRASPMRKPATEFRDHRSYVPGDDVRYVDWKASARQEHIFIKQGEQQKAAVVYVLLDCSASMGWGSPPRSLTALQLANALGYLALANGDRLVMMPVTGANPRNEVWRPDGQAPGLKPFGPLSGKGQAPQLTSYLQALRFQGQVNLTRSLLQIGRRRISNGGLVLVISDLFGNDDLARGLEALPAPAWRVVVFHLLHPAELNPALDGYLEMQDVETGKRKRVTVTPKAINIYQQRLKAWQEELEQRTAEKRGLYTMLTAGASLEHEILPELRRLRVVRPL